MWFELGYALASGRQLILVCAKGRPKYPFDIQHRTIISYETEYPRDFVKLKESITERARALVKKELNQEQIRIASVSVSSGGLPPHELTFLATVAAQSEGFKGSVSLHDVKSEMERSGFNSLATTLGLKSLSKKGFITMSLEQDWSGNNTYETYRPTTDGWDWIERNLHLLNLRLEIAPYSRNIDDDIPF